MNSKFDMAELLDNAEQWRSKGERIVFTNGVFDILHVGHVTYLSDSAKLGDRLVVGINSDASVKRLNKGPERPLNSEFARATVVSALRYVDAVIIFNEDTPLNVITQLNPDILVKGGDYDANEKDSSKKTFIVGSKEVLANGGRVVAIPLVAGYSTTSIVSRMK